MFFVLSNDVDTKGLSYAKALQQLMVGVYISEICLLGLFSINTTIGPIVLMGVFLVFTAIYHGAMRYTVKTLIMYIPRPAANSDQADLSMSPAIDMNNPAKPDDIPLTELDNRVGEPEDFVADSEAFRNGLLFKFFESKIFQTDWPANKFTFQSLEAPIYGEDALNEAYFNPAMISPAPMVWIVKDVMNISAKEVQDTHSSIRISDAHATFNEVGDIEWDQERFDQVPIWEDKIYY